MNRLAKEALKIRGIHVLLVLGVLYWLHGWLPHCVDELALSHLPKPHICSFAVYVGDSRGYSTKISMTPRKGEAFTTYRNRVCNRWPGARIYRCGNSPKPWYTCKKPPAATSQPYFRPMPYVGEKGQRGISLEY